jgi:hypothetical protein
MLTGDPIEAIEQARAFLKEGTVVAYYDQILVGALRLAQADAEQGRLDDVRLESIFRTVPTSLRTWPSTVTAILRRLQRRGGLRRIAKSSRWPVTNSESRSFVFLDWAGWTIVGSLWSWMHLIAQASMPA